jgi:hypothetical protein
MRDHGVTIVFDLVAKSVLQTTEDRSLTLLGALRRIYSARGIGGLYQVRGACGVAHVDRVA